MRDEILTLTLWPFAISIIVLTVFAIFPPRRLFLAGHAWVAIAVLMGFQALCFGLIWVLAATGWVGMIIIPIVYSYVLSVPVFNVVWAFWAMSRRLAMAPSVFAIVNALAVALIVYDIRTH